MESRDEILRRHQWELKEFRGRCAHSNIRWVPVEGSLKGCAVARYCEDCNSVLAVTHTLVPYVVERVGIN